MTKRKLDLTNASNKEIIGVLDILLKKNKSDVTCTEVGKHLCYSESMKTCPINVMTVPDRTEEYETLLLFWNLKYNLDSYKSK
jgi:hypothetical protein